MLNSVWTENVKMPRFESLEGDRRTDVLIVGGGIAGLLCGYELRQRGIDHILIEADRICHGVTRNTTAKLTSQHGLIYHKIASKYGDEAAFLYWQANEDAIAKYRQLAEKYSCDLEKQDNYIYSKSNKKLLDDEMAVLSRLGIPAKLTAPSDLPFQTLGAVCFSNQGQFHPLKFLSQIAREVNICEHTAAKQFAPHTVITDRGKIKAKKIVVATHFPLLNKHGAFFLKMYQDRSYVLALEGAKPMEGMYLDEGKDGLSFRTFGDLLLIGCGSHRTGKKTGGWAAAEGFAKEYVPNAKIRCRWATQDCMTLDGIPYIGQYSKNTPDLYVATGFNKWGMTSAMVAASVLADLIEEKENPYASLFSPGRGILHPQLIVNGFEAAGGLLRFSAPRCPHMGCSLKWNPIEHSWDCSCHGSRFSPSGKLENEPATGDLKHRRTK